MNSNPLLSDRQWRKISALLPENRHDPVMIAAILYLEFSGESLRHAAELFGLTKTRLNEWRNAIAADLPRIMVALRLEPAGGLARRRGGRVFYGNNPAMMAEIAGLRLRNFRDALRAGSR